MNDVHSASIAPVEIVDHFKSMGYPESREAYIVWAGQHHILETMDKKDSNIKFYPSLKKKIDKLVNECNLNHLVKMQSAIAGLDVKSHFGRSLER